MKIYCKYSIFVVLFIFLCYSCIAEKDSTPKTSDQIVKTVFNPEIAGINHNQCLDIFYKKLQNLKVKQTRIDNPDLDIDDVVKENAIIESLVECLENMTLEEDIKEEIQNELSDIIDFFDKNPNEEITNPDWSEHALLLADRLEVIINTDYADAIAAINDIVAIENDAKQNLSEFECNKILTSAAIMRHSLIYWYDNYAMWFPVQTRASVNWKNVATADCDWALRAAGFGNIFPGAQYSVLKWGMRALRIASWQAQVLILTTVAAAGSIAEAVSEDTALAEEEAVEEMEDDLCCVVAEKAIRIFISEDCDEKEETEGEEEN